MPAIIKFAFNGSGMNLLPSDFEIPNRNIRLDQNGSATPAPLDIPPEYIESRNLNLDCAISLSFLQQDYVWVCFLDKIP